MTVTVLWDVKCKSSIEFVRALRRNFGKALYTHDIPTCANLNYKTFNYNICLWFKCIGPAIELSQDYWYYHTVPVSTHPHCIYIVLFEILKYSRLCK